VTTAREKSVLKAALKILREELRPRKILLFGSRAKGTQRKGSDFDLALDCPKPPGRKAERLEERISEKSGLFRIDLVYLPAATKDFRDIILSTGKVVYAKGN